MQSLLSRVYKSLIDQQTVFWPLWHTLTHTHKTKKGCAVEGCGKLILLRRLQKLTGCKLSRRVLEFIESDPSNFNLAFYKFYTGDIKVCLSLSPFSVPCTTNNPVFHSSKIELQVIKEVVKDMNLISHAGLNTNSFFYCFLLFISKSNNNINFHRGISAEDTCI